MRAASRPTVKANNAGVVFLDDAENLSEREWDLTIEVNQKAVFLTSQAVGKKMIAAGGGKIINIASQAGIIALDKHIAYCASKAAVISITKGLGRGEGRSDDTGNSKRPFRLPR